ncbi:MAG: hypothetical protein PHV33_08550 [Elusimicrobiales bacterium]|nr:hypothetical protein [Elusimicrobiales bacterium]
MSDRKEKLSCQLRLMAAFKEFSGPAPEGLFTKKEFFIVRLQAIGALLDEFKREKLKELADWLAARLARGALREADLAAFKQSLSQLVSGQDYNAVNAALAGSKELLLQRLSRVQPLSAAEEEKKRPGQFRELALDKLVSAAYTRMAFEGLEKEFTVGRPEEDILEQARARAAKFCSSDTMPLGLDNTMPSNMLNSIEAAAGACFRLLARLKR